MFVFTATLWNNNNTQAHEIRPEFLDNGKYLILVSEYPLKNVFNDEQNALDNEGYTISRKLVIY